MRTFTGVVIYVHTGWTHPARYEREIQTSIDNGTITHDLKWLMPCFAEDVARVLEKEVGSHCRSLWTLRQAREERAAFTPC